jgi:hypothetical protein
MSSKANPEEQSYEHGGFSYSLTTDTAEYKLQELYIAV